MLNLVELCGTFSYNFDYIPCRRNRAPVASSGFHAIYTIAAVGSAPAIAAGALFETLNKDRCKTGLDRFSGFSGLWPGLAERSALEIGATFGSSSRGRSPPFSPARWGCALLTQSWRTKPTGSRFLRPLLPEPRHSAQGRLRQHDRASTSVDAKAKRKIACLWTTNFVQYPDVTLNPTSQHRSSGMDRQRRDTPRSGHPRREPYA